MAEKWSIRGSLIGACSCDWGCPCNFDARPTKGFCDGGYTWAIKEGSYGNVSLNGLMVLWLSHSPGPLHEGNVTAVVVVDERASASQRHALEALFDGNGIGSPFDILAGVTRTRIPTIYAPIDVTLDGIRSQARVAGGDVAHVVLSRIKNPVTGDDEEIYLDKPTGFTSRRTELGTATTSRVQIEGLRHQHDGQYGEYAEFEYAGP